MSDHKLSATGYGSKAGDAGQRASRAGGLEQGDGRQAEMTRRTVGVYERPARRTRLLLPLLVIVILSALVSVVMAARFLF